MSMDMDAIVNWLTGSGWLVAFFVLLAIELATVSLVSIWFACGALAAYITNILGANIYIQIVVFIIVSAVIMALVRPLAVKVINNNTEKTNVDAIAGKRAKVLTGINNIEGIGTVMIDGLEWTARSEDDSIIEPDAFVEVVRVEGVKAIVRKVN